VCAWISSAQTAAGTYSIAEWGGLYTAGGAKNRRWALMLSAGNAYL
jgi:hypothetical protein